VTVGVLALQGDVREHVAALGDLGVPSRPVRRPEDLAGLSGLVLPGGESTTLSMLLTSAELFDPIDEALRRGLPTLATCAGLVLVARVVEGGRSDQRSFGVLDAVVQRNAYGGQLESFETDLGAPKLSAELGADDDPLPAVFIRAPVVERVGADVEVLASLPLDGARSTPVLCRQGNVLATAFHPELTADRRVHHLFARMAGE
jgi:pyridoxal 5'-phosphate synthase pdxT subunit